MEKIVVTGSCGFIGYNFIKSNSSNFKIIGIDSLNNAYDSKLKELRLTSLNEITELKIATFFFFYSALRP